MDFYFCGTDWTHNGPVTKEQFDAIASIPGRRERVQFCDGGDGVRMHLVPAL